MNPRSTGQVARLLNTTEPRLAEQVRRGKVDPAPPVVAGRRLWDATHILQAADGLGVERERVLEQLEEQEAAQRKRRPRGRAPMRGQATQEAAVRAHSTPSRGAGQGGAR